MKHTSNTLYKESAEAAPQSAAHSAAHSTPDSSAASSLPQARGAADALPVTLRVNGQFYSIIVEPRRTLLDALRHNCGLTGAKKVCEMGNCGACTVVMDGEAVYACLVLAAECEGREITTIEAEDATLNTLQQAFLEHDAYQCGYCTPGQILSLKALLDREPQAGEAAIQEAVAGNLCRCGAYQHILQAARSVSSPSQDTAGKQQDKT